MIEIKVTSTETENDDMLDIQSSAEVDGNTIDISTEITAGIICLFETIAEVTDEDTAYKIIRTAMQEADDRLSEQVYEEGEDM